MLSFFICWLCLASEICIWTVTWVLKACFCCASSAASSNLDDCLCILNFVKDAGGVIRPLYHFGVFKKTGTYGRARVLFCQLNLESPKDLLSCLGMRVERQSTIQYEFYPSVPTENLWLIMCFYLHLALYIYICIYVKIYMYRASHLIAQFIKNLPAMQQTLVQFLVWEDPLKKGKATHSNILAWRIPWTTHGDYPWDCTWVAKSWTGLSDFHFHFPYICIS